MKKTEVDDCKRYGRLAPGTAVVLHHPAYPLHEAYGVVLSNWGRTPSTGVWTYIIRIMHAKSGSEDGGCIPIAAQVRGNLTLHHPPGRFSYPGYRIAGILE